MSYPAVSQHLANRKVHDPSQERHEPVGRHDHSNAAGRCSAWADSRVPATQTLPDSFCCSWHRCVHGFL